MRVSPIARLRRWTRLCLTTFAVLTGTAAPALAQPVPAVAEYYHLDALGSTRVVTSQTGAVLRHYEFGPFGGQDSQCTQSPDKRLFTGQVRDRETCLDYFGARHMRSTFGRFLSIDPVLDTQAALVDPQQWNRYAYARNNPMKFVDPDGRVLETAWDVASLGISLYSVWQDPSNVWNWVAAGVDAVSVVGPGIPAIGAAIRGGGRADDAIDAARTLRHGSGPASGVLEISSVYKSSRAVQNYSGAGAEFVFDAASNRFVMGSMKHRVLADRAGIAASELTVGGIIQRRGNRLITNEQSGTFGRNWTPEIRLKFRQFMKEHGITVE